MALSAFSERTVQPGDAELRSVLGRAYDAWVRLLALTAESINPMNVVWGFSGASTGWGLRVRHNERVIFYMTPQQNQFLVSFALGEKAAAAANGAHLAARVRKAIESAPRYAEGRGVRLQIKNTRELASLVRLALIKSRS